MLTMLFNGVHGAADDADDDLLPFESVNAAAKGQRPNTSGDPESTRSNIRSIGGSLAAGET